MPEFASRGVSAPGGGGVSAGGCLLPGGVLWGVSAPGGVCSRWGSAPGGEGVGIPACTEAAPTPHGQSDTHV